MLSGGGGLVNDLGGELLPGRLASGALAFSLLGAGHGVFAGANSEVQDSAPDMLLTPIAYSNILLTPTLMKT